MLKTEIIQDFLQEKNCFKRGPDIFLKASLSLSGGRGDVYVCSNFSYAFLACSLSPSEHLVTNLSKQCTRWSVGSCISSASHPDLWLFLVLFLFLFFFLFCLCHPFCSMLSSAPVIYIISRPINVAETEAFLCQTRNDTALLLTA